MRVCTEILDHYKSSLWKYEEHEKPQALTTPQLNEAIWLETTATNSDKPTAKLYATPDQGSRADQQGTNLHFSCNEKNQLSVSLVIAEQWKEQLVDLKLKFDDQPRQKIKNVAVKITPNSKVATIHFDELKGSQQLINNLQKHKTLQIRANRMTLNFNLSNVAEKTEKLMATCDR